MSLEVRPSKLIEWARCQLRAQHRTLRPRKDRYPVPHIASWIGTEVHAMLADREPSPVPSYVAFDTITPNREAAFSQIDRIVGYTRAAMVARHWCKHRYEVEVGTEQPFQGTIDLIFDGQHDPAVGGWAIADVKTGRISDGVWLQLGAYMNAIEQGWERFGQGVVIAMKKVVLIHAPRTSLYEEQKCEVTIRDAGKCKVAAKLLADIAYNVVHEDWTPVPMPGRHCSSCEVMDCAVRAQ